MSHAAPWPSYREEDVEKLLTGVCEPGERLEVVALAYERASWQELAWTAVRSALQAGLLGYAWGSNEELGQAYVVALTDRRLIFAACRPAAGSAETKRGGLVRQSVASLPRSALGADALAGGESDGYVALGVETGALRRRVFFEAQALPDNLQRARAMWKALGA